jgi:hypothetical protein
MSGCFGEYFQRKCSPLNPKLPPFTLGPAIDPDDITLSLALLKRHQDVSVAPSIFITYYAVIPGTKTQSLQNHPQTVLHYYSRSSLIVYAPMDINVG